MREQILYYAVKYKGEWKYIQKAIEANEPWEKIEYNGNFVTVLDKEYPEKLRKLQYAPWILFYEGNLALLDRKSAGLYAGICQISMLWLVDWQKELIPLRISAV